MPNANLTKYQKGVYYMGIKLFNHLPPKIKSLNYDIKVFKPALKDYLLFHSFYSVDNFCLCWIFLFLCNRYVEISCPYRKNFLEFWFFTWIKPLCLHICIKNTQVYVYCTPNRWYACFWGSMQSCMWGALACAENS